MTDFKVGDKVRVTHEGTVTYIYKSDDGLDLDGRYVGSRDGTVEVLERARLRPGTVTRAKGTGLTYVRTEFGFLGLSGGYAREIAPSDALEHDLASGRHEIVYEPPTS